MMDSRIQALSTARVHLHYAEIESFGRFSKATIGPFGPGLNVVVGESEAGKSTVAAFIAGVLFGWPEGRHGQGLFLPAGRQRAGALTFSPYARLVRRGETAQIEGDVEILAELDVDQFDALMFLTEERLASERLSEDLTALLLASGGASEACGRALEHVRERLGEFTSTSALSEHSLVRLGEERALLRHQLEQADEREAGLLRADRERSELQRECEALRHRLHEAQLRLERLEEAVAAEAALRAKEEENAQAMAQQQEVQKEARDQRQRLAAEVGEALATMTPSKDRAVRDRLSELKDREERHARSLDVARSNFSTSKTAYEVLGEALQDEGALRHRAATRRMQMLLSAVFPVALVLAGVPLFVWGRMEGSLSIALLGIALVIGAFLLAAGAFMLILGSSRRQDSRDDRLDDALWVMRQDEKKLRALEQEAAAFRADVDQELASFGLAAAEGSLRAARSLLDEAKAHRAAMATEDQRIKSAEATLASLRDKQRGFAQERARLALRAEVADFADGAALEAEREERRRRVEELTEALHRLEARQEEAERRLAEAPHNTGFDELKQRLEGVNARLADSRDEFEMLLLAEHFLQVAVDTWRAATEPSVYREAGRIMGAMTHGRWTGIAVSAEGELQVTGRGRSCPLAELSLGTRQLLSLALRMAVLQVHPAACPVAPVLADDIMGSFDATRRRGVAQALADLAKVRQVIVFTSQEQTAEALLEEEPQATVVRLAARES